MTSFIRWIASQAAQAAQAVQAASAANAGKLLDTFNEKLFT